MITLLASCHIVLQFLIGHREGCGERGRGIEGEMDIDIETYSETYIFRRRHERDGERGTDIYRERDRDR